MKTCDEMRRDRLNDLCKESGKVGALAVKIGKSETQIRQWINASKDSRTGKPRGISDDVARHIEIACGKPRGWMDNPPFGELRMVGEVAASNLSQEAIDVARKFDRLAMKQRAAIVNSIDSYFPDAKANRA